MIWQLTEAKAGDMVRAQVGHIYHYGIFVDEETIVQFGLSPAARAASSDRDVCVCTSSVDVFLQGAFLEVGVPDKAERKKLKRPQEIVAAALARLGEKGYNILYNNCEHFAYECCFGEKYSSQTERVRALFQAFPILDIYVAKIPEGDFDASSIVPPARKEAILSAGSETVRRERYYVWKLLEYALLHTFGKKLSSLQFTQTPHGKWECNGCEFSLSHSHGVVCVALSRKPVGVDIELLAPPKSERFAQKILCEKEFAEYSTLPPSQQTQFLMEKWTQKESIFKCVQGEKLPSHIDTTAHQTMTKLLCIGESTYCLSVASPCLDRLRLHENVSLQGL